MIGKLTSLDPLERNVELQISTDSLRSEISNPQGDVAPQRVNGYVIEQRNDVFHLIMKLDGQHSKTIDFYRTQSKGDLALLLDLLDGTIGERPRKMNTN